MKRPIVMIITLLLLVTICGCAVNRAEEEGIDYMVLVNKLNKLPEDWESKLKTVHFTNSIGEDVEVEEKAYEAYQKLQKDLEAEGIYVDLDSARRSIEAQQQIVDDFTAEYGAEYTAKVVAVPGYSEHHTGLALDLYLIVDGKDIIYNEDLVTYPEIWEAIHAKLAQYGFILRYLEGKEHITGYAYEPWHIRYIDDPEAAKEIMDKGMTFEGYLGAVNETDVTLDCGSSELYTEEEIDEVITLIKCRFASWKDCELHSITYAGDEASAEGLEYINSLDENSQYSRCMELLMDFHSPKEESGSFEPDYEYENYQWYVGLNEKDEWDIVSWGY